MSSGSSDYVVELRFACIPPVPLRGRTYNALESRFVLDRIFIRTVLPPFSNQKLVRNSNELGSKEIANSGGGADTKLVTSSKPHSYRLIAFLFPPGCVKFTKYVAPDTRKIDIASDDLSVLVQSLN
jgi:hypothetical protein